MTENVFEAVKQSVSTRDAAAFYGIEVKRNEMCIRDSNTACPVCVTDKSKCTGKAPEPPTETPEPEKEKPAGLNPAAIVLLLALLGLSLIHL